MQQRKISPVERVFWWFLPLLAAGIIIAVVYF
jgi:hypothetical protein